MASWEEGHWESSVDAGVPAAARRSGAYFRYIPDLVDGAGGLAIDGMLSRRVGRVERSIRL